MNIIESTGITKSFGNKKVLKGIDLNIKKGSIHAILGPNGSGKTTLIRIFSTLIKANSGTIKVAGHDVFNEPAKVRSAISLTAQNASVDEELTGYENLFLFARLMGFPVKEARQRANELLNLFELKKAANKLVNTYSGGMRRRLDIAATIVRRTELLYLDEPTTGLDPHSRNALWDIIRGLAAKGTTVLLTTQYLEEAEQLADRISVIDDGVVISEGTGDELKASVGNNMLHVYLNGQDKNFLESVLEQMQLKPTKSDGDGKKLTFPVSGQSEAIGVLSKLESKNVEITAFNLSRPDLTEVFLSLTGNQKVKNGTSNPVVESNEAVPGSISIENLLAHAEPNKKVGVLSNKLMFGWRNLVKIKHIPEQFVDVLITPIMFTFMFTYIFGGALAGSTKAYLQFFIPGILVQTFAFNAMYSGMNINNDVTKGIFNRFRSLPIWLPAPLSGLFIGDFFRHLISGIIVLLLGFVLGFRSDAGFFAFAASFLLMIFFAMSISLVFIILGLTMRNISAVMSVGWLMMMPLVFMSNIFTDPGTMPNWLQTFIQYNPLAWQVDAVRGLLAANVSGAAIFKAISASVVITLLLFPITTWFYKKER
ncbi:MAG: ATP-binding cassette domain-containing protein [Bacteroidales bacterium]|nr:ATP-binding cassette domain-containing protein [Bacteroidales bacterium]